MTKILILYDLHCLKKINSTLHLVNNKQNINLWNNYTKKCKQKKLNSFSLFFCYRIHPFFCRCYSKFLQVIKITLNQVDLNLIACLYIIVTFFLLTKKTKQKRYYLLVKLYRQPFCLSKSIIYFIFWITEG